MRAREAPKQEYEGGGRKTLTELRDIPRVEGRRVVAMAYWYGNNYAGTTQLTPIENLAMVYREDLCLT